MTPVSYFSITFLVTVGSCYFLGWGKCTTGTLRQKQIKIASGSRGSDVFEYSAKFIRRTVFNSSSTDKAPIKNNLFDNFLTEDAASPGSYVAKNTLLEWQAKNHPWLELTDVHRETTENVRVTVMPFYMGCREVQLTQVYWWRYCIRLEHLGEGAVQLRGRHWRIFSLSGTLETVRGRGIIGKEPVFSRELPAFQYTSHVSLQAPSGHMWGTYKMEREDGSTFECRIPPFTLDSKHEDGNTPHGFVV